jgi:hypothetical protein
MVADIIVLLATLIQQAICIFGICLNCAINDVEKQEDSRNWVAKFLRDSGTSYSYASGILFVLVTNHMVLSLLPIHNMMPLPWEICLQCKLNSRFKKTTLHDCTLITHVVHMHFNESRINFHFSVVASINMKKL